MHATRKRGCSLAENQSNMFINNDVRYFIKKVLTTFRSMGDFLLIHETVALWRKVRCLVQSEPNAHKACRSGCFEALHVNSLITAFDVLIKLPVSSHLPLPHHLFSPYDRVDNFWWDTFGRHNSEIKPAPVGDGFEAACRPICITFTQMKPSFLHLMFSHPQYSPSSFHTVCTRVLRAIRLADPAFIYFTFLSLFYLGKGDGCASDHDCRGDKRNWWLRIDRSWE